MRRIDRTNYEAWLLDRLEGRLSPDEERVLDAFLQAHPDLVPDRAPNARITDERVEFAPKAGLRRSLPPRGTPDARTLDDFLVARIEGDLDPGQVKALEALLDRDPFAAQAWRLMQRARIEVPAVSYPDRSRLKKKTARVIPIAGGWRRFAAAASIALLAGLAWWALRRDDAPEARVAGTRKTEQTRPTLPDRPAQEQVPEQEEIRPDRSEATRSIVSPTENNPPMVADRVQRELIHPVDRIALRWPGAEEPRHAPLVAEVKAVPPTTGAPVEFAEAPPRAHGTAMSMGELLTSTLRTRVLDRPDDLTALGDDDAVALVDKGLGAISGDKAGFTVQHDGEKRRRFRLALGDNLALTASTGR